MIRKRIPVITGAIIFLQLFGGCAASSSRFYNTWSMKDGFAVLLKDEKGKRTIPASAIGMMVGTGLLDVDPSRPDWEKIYRRIQHILDHEDRYHFCPNGYKIVPGSVGFERHGTYVSLSVMCNRITVDKNNPSVDMPVKGTNNIGTAGKVDPNSIFGEGGYISRIANQIPVVNAVGGMHDVFQIQLEAWGGNIARNIFNVPGMMIAAAITYPGMLDLNLALPSVVVDQIRR